MGMDSETWFVYTVVFHQCWRGASIQFRKYLFYTSRTYTNSRADWPLLLSSLPPPSLTLAFQQYKNTTLCLSTLPSGSLGEDSAGTWNHPLPQAWISAGDLLCTPANWDVENCGLKDVVKEEGNQVNSIFWWIFSHPAFEEQRKKNDILSVRKEQAGEEHMGLVKKL